jgi:hypothetical protein
MKYLKHRKANEDGTRRNELAEAVTPHIKIWGIQET